MQQNEWQAERTYLREKFSSGDITKATRKELERYLVVLANATPNGYAPGYREEADRFAVVIRHLLQIRLGEELHEKSHRISVLAFVVAIAAAAFAGFEAWNVYKTRQQTTPQFAPANSPAQLPSH